jgi:N-acetylmuramoyl-L-alanine amidase
MKSKKLLHVIVKYICFTIVICLIIFYELNSYSAEPGIKKENFIIAIDAGHSEYSPGAIGARGTKEYVLNKIIAQLLNEKLIENGFKKSFVFNYEGRKVSLKNRVDKIKSSKYDVFISIHHDSVQPIYMSTWIYKGRQFNYCDQYKGFSIFISDNNIHGKGSLNLSSCIGDALVKSGFKPSLHHAELIQGENRKLIDRGDGIYEFNDLAVLKNANAPATLIECGIIVNRDEEILLNDPSYQKKLVSDISMGIVHYFEEVK